MTRAKRHGSRGARRNQEQRWAARSGSVYIVRPADRPTVTHQLDGLDLARRQIRFYTQEPKVRIIPS